MSQGWGQQPAAWQAQGENQSLCRRRHTCSHRTKAQPLSQPLSQPHVSTPGGYLGLQRPLDKASRPHVGGPTCTYIFRPSPTFWQTSAAGAALNQTAGRAASDHALLQPFYTEEPPVPPEFHWPFRRRHEQSVGCTLYTRHM